MRLAQSRALQRLAQHTQGPPSPSPARPRFVAQELRQSQAWSCGLSTRGLPLTRYPLTNYQTPSLIRMSPNSPSRRAPCGTGEYLALSLGSRTTRKAGGAFDAGDDLQPLRRLI